MKYSAVFTLIFLTLFSACSNRKEYDPEEYKRQQAEYEKKKREIELEKGLFFADNKQKLIDMVKKVDDLKNQTLELEDVNSDTTFFYNEGIINPINFGMRFESSFTIARPSAREENADLISSIIIEKDSDSEEAFDDPLKELRQCLKLNPDIDCINIKVKELTKIANLKYAFIYQKILMQRPTLSGNEYNSGIFFAQFICYDLVNEKPFYRFTASATSSETVEFRENSFSRDANTYIQRDFNKNIDKGITDAFKKHFNIVSDIQSVQIGF